MRYTNTATDVHAQAIAAPDVTTSAPTISLCARRGMSPDATRMLAGLLFLESVAAAERAIRDAETGGRR